MEAAIGRTIAHRDSAGVCARLLACTTALLALPGWCQDVPIGGLDLAAVPVERMRDATSAQPSAAPRLSLTLGTPIAAPGFANGTQPLDLGVQWRHPVLQSHVDITAWRRMTAEPDALALIRSREPVYGARVEFNLQGKQRGLVADKRFIGLQLDSGARITLRRKDGNPTLYYRTQF